MTYQFRTASGSTCCETDRADLLCPTCKAQLAAGQTVLPPPSLTDHIRAVRGLPTPTVTADRALNIHGVPEPPSLIEAVKARRA